jgi:hypothetical protein
MSTDANIPVLSYGAQPRRSQRRVAILAVILLTAALIIGFREPLGRLFVRRYEVAMLYRTEQDALQIELPADSPLYDGSAEVRITSQKLSDAWMEINRRLMLTTGAILATTPPRTPPQGVTPIGPRSGVLMLENMTSPDGTGFHVSCGVSDFYLIARAWRPGTLVTTLQPMTQRVTMLEVEPPAALDRMKIYPGQRDPTDRSRFIVRYNIDGKDRRVIGTVGDDGVICFTGDGVLAAPTTAPARDAGDFRFVESR